ncbi:MAG: hypothetical protein JW729_01840 [Bacteroidales bacterium]|nr:hypothetical protein [Bacteroidales bacterium]
MIVVNKEQSRKIGEIVKKLEFKSSFYERDFIQINSPLKMAMHFYAVGICHQTYHLANPKLNLYGWDYLEYGFLDILKKAPHLLEAQKILSLSKQELIENIQPFFSQDSKPENCTLDTLDERADLWMDMAKIIQEKFDGKIENLFQNRNWEKKQNADAIYTEFKKFEAYSDPLQKKSGVFLKLIEDAKLINLENVDQLIPIMDYHMQRVLLRTGCIKVIDQNLKYKLQHRLPITDDEPIRKASIEAMQIITKIAGYHIFKMNDVFYTLGRSCCNENTLCRTNTCEKTPCTLTRAVKIENHEHCIFQQICKGAINEDYHSFWQPQIKTHFY